jgi:hypothetical protein
MLIPDADPQTPIRETGNRKGYTMAEQDHTPDIDLDDTEGHTMKKDDADDTAGHTMKKDDADDTEGHTMKKDDEDDDTEGHTMKH